MLRLDVHSSINGDDWNRHVCSLGGCCFHSCEWSIFRSKNTDSSPVYFRLRNEKENILAAWSAVEIAKGYGYIKLGRSLSFASLPASQNPDILVEMIRQVIDYSWKNGFTSITVNSFGTPFDTDRLGEMGFSTEKRWEFLLSLEGDEDNLWKKIHSKKRNLIRKAQKAGLRVENVKLMDQVAEFRDLAVETWKRKTEQGIAFPEPADLKYYELLKECLIDKGLGRLYMAYEDEQPIAGAFFVGYNMSAYYLLSSANETGLKKSAPDLLLWTSMTDFQRDGFDTFNLGGLAEKELKGQPLEKSGLYHFKKRFSAEAFPCFTGSLVLRAGKEKTFRILKHLKSKLHS